MRAFLDTNIFISYLLGAGANSAVARVVEAGVLGDYTLLVSKSLLAELSEAVKRKPYLAQRITAEDLTIFIELILQVAEATPEIYDPIPAVVRDAKDDYILAHALLARADYLVTGDNDLLVLKRVDTMEILTPAAFAAKLEQIR